MSFNGCMKNAACAVLGGSASRVFFMPAVFISIFVVSTITKATVFQVSVPGGAMIAKGAAAYLDIYIDPGTDANVVGGQCTVTVDPAVIQISGDRNKYAAAPSLELVEKFTATPDKGIVMFRAKSKKAITERQIFLRVPFVFKKAGSTSLSFASSVIFGDDKTAPSNPGYFRLYGYEGDEPDAVLMAAAAGENVLLTTESLGDRFEISKVPEGQKQADLSLALAGSGMTLSELEAANDEAAADVVVGFNKRTAKVGVRQWVRLDVMIDKFPASEELSSIEFKVKYDPSYLAFTDMHGRETNKVYVPKPIEGKNLEQLKAMAQDLGISYSKDETLEHLTDSINTSRRGMVKSYFTDQLDILGLGLTNLVNQTNGEVTVQLIVPIEYTVQETKPPVPVITLYFKGLRAGKDIPVKIEQVKLPVQGGKQYLRPTLVTISPDYHGCDQTLPSELCAGTFTLAGTVSFTIEKQKEWRTVALVRQIDEETQTTTTDTTNYNKFALKQSWNVSLGGRLKSGITVSGMLSEMPEQPQQYVDVLLSSGNGSAHFGTFDTSFESGNYMKLDKKINGVQFDYKKGKFNFTSLTAETKSTTETAQLPAGTNTKGPYTLPSNTAAMIPGTEHIFDKDGKEMSAAEYQISYNERVIYFNEPVPSGEVRTMTYEKSTYLFTIGSLNAFQVGYSALGKGTTEERIKIGASYMMSQAPKSTTRSTGSDSVTMSSIDTSTTVPCPNNSARTCLPVELGHFYIVPGSVTVTAHPSSVSGAVTYQVGELNSPVVLDHRSYYIGRIYIDNTDTNKIAPPITVNFDYYKLDYVQETGFISYQIPENLNILDTSKWPWPTDVFPGSEFVLISSDQANYPDNPLDAMLCYSETGTPDNTAICPNANYQSMDPIITYYLSHENQTYIVFDQPVNYMSGKYQYVKVKYAITPGSLPTGSEFNKTALDLTGKFKIGKSLSITGEYATTNSDLASTYSTTKESITIDASSTNLTDNDVIPGKTCGYYGVRKDYGSDGERELVCNLSHSNLTGDVQVSIQYCERKEGDWRNECVRSGDTIQYYSTQFQVPSAYVDVDKSNGQVVLIRKRNSESDSTEPGFTEYGHAFPNTGDLVTVNYIFDKSLGRLVDGTAHTMTMKYRKNKVSAEITETTQDPFFDNGISGTKALANKDELTGSLSFPIGQMSLTMSSKSSSSSSLSSTTLKQTAGTDITEKSIGLKFRKWDFSFNSTQTDTSTWSSTTYKKSSLNSVSGDTYSMKYFAKGHLRTISLSRKTDMTDYIQSMDTQNASRALTTTTSDIMLFTTAFMKKDKLTLNGGYTSSEIDSPGNVLAAGKGSISSLTAMFKPMKNLDIKTDYTKKITQNMTPGKTTAMSFHYLAFNYLDIITDFKKTVSSIDSSSTTTPGVNQDDKFTISLRKNFMRTSNLKFELATNRTPVTSTTTGSRSDTKNVSFNVKLPFSLTWTPSYSTSETGTGSATSESENTSWTLNYLRSNKKIKSAKWTKTMSHQKAATASKTDTLNVSLIPSRYTNAEVNFTRSPASKTTTWNTKYGYTYNEKVRFALSFNAQRNSLASTNKVNYIFDTIYNITNKTSLKLNYSQILGAGLGTQKTTNFSATISSTLN